MPTYEISPFSDPAAVDAWDTWFRWRDGSHLYDVSIEATWLRVARALAAVEKNEMPRWIRRFVDAQAGWQLLFDQKILASAGTDHADWPEAPIAVLNAARFVTAPFTNCAQFDFAAFARLAELAVRGLDNALLAQANGREPKHEIRIGLIGVGDALLMLDKEYATVEARLVAGAIARTLAESCLRASLALARERGACPGAGKLIQASQTRLWPSDLLAELAHGTRHSALTAITSQRRLALLANQVTDALDPISCDKAARLRSPGYGIAQAQRYASEDYMRGLLAGLKAHDCSSNAQLAMRNAVQSWIDADIDYPLQTANAVNLRLAQPAQVSIKMPRGDTAR